ncbi:MAG: DUF4097 domain-containing protein [Acidobacteriota bacterium]|nr:DUF4097 domain-containing protein [Acidobacteriota bacterium]
MRTLAALTLALAVAAPLFAADDTIRKGFNVAEGGTLHLDADLGPITIVSGGSGVAVEVVRSTGGRRGEERLRDHKIEFRQSGNDVYVEDDLPRISRWTWNDDYEVAWNIRVPAHYNVDVSTSGGAIKLANIGGNVDAETSGGSISTGTISGRANLETSGGSIHVAGANGEVLAHTSGGSIEIGNTNGRVEAKTSGGSIRLSQIDGDVVARTSGGGIRIDNARGSIDAHTSGGPIVASLAGPLRDDTKLATSGGSVTLTLTGNVNAELDAQTSGGSVSSDVPVTVQGTQNDGTLQGRIGAGGPRLVLRSSGGGIRVKRG